MGKYRGGKLRRWDKLSLDTQADLLFDLLSAFSLLRSVDDSARFITDLLTRDEVRFLSKRLRIAKLLILDWKYREIETSLKVSHATIAKVAAWLQEKGEGFREVVKRIPERRKPEERGGESRDKFKRSHPASFWPELMLERWRSESVRDEANELRSTLRSLDSKDVINHRVQETYEEDFKRPRNKRR